MHGAACAGSAGAGVVSAGARAGRLIRLRARTREDGLVALHGRTGRGARGGGRHGGFVDRARAGHRHDDAAFFYHRRRGSSGRFNNRRRRCRDQRRRRGSGYGRRRSFDFRRLDYDRRGWRRGGGGDRRFFHWRRGRLGDDRAGRRTRRNRGRRGDDVRRLTRLRNDSSRRGRRHRRQLGYRHGGWKICNRNCLFCRDGDWGNRRGRRGNNCGTRTPTMRGGFFFRLLLLDGLENVAGLGNFREINLRPGLSRGRH